MNLKKRSGFTMIEILIVIAILATLSALAIPMYTAQVEKSRKVEALDMLSNIRAAEIRYFSEKNTFTTDLTKLDFTPKNTAAPADVAAATDTAGQKHHFWYAVAGNADITTSFKATATRNTVVDGGDAANKVTITNDGTVGGAGIWA